MNTTPHDIIEEVRGLLRGSVEEVFRTLFSVETQEETPGALLSGAEPLIAGSVGFVGDVTGVVYLHVSQAHARSLAAHMLGMPESEIADDMVNDVVGEIANMVVGGVKSRLCDTGNPCVLSIPSIIRGKNLSAEPSGSSQGRIFGVACGAGHLLVELIMKQAA